MKQPTKLRTLLLILFTTTLFSQSKRVADRYFEEFAYIKAAKIYEAVYQKGDTSKYILKRLGDAYYNNSKTEKAAFWYRKLIEDKKEKDPAYIFKYSQVLRSNGDIKKSDLIYSRLEKEENISSREVFLDETDYFQDFINEGEKKISIRNLSINTPFSDFGGYIFNNEVYFASSSPKKLKKEKLYKWNNQPFLNIYKSKGFIDKSEDSKQDSIFELTEKTILPSPVNTEFHESSVAITKDGRYMYFSRVNYNGKKLKKDKKKTVNLKLYRAENIDDEWRNIIELPFNNDEYSVAHPALSPDDKILYFTSDMPGSLGKTDLYKIEIKKEGYGDPINLGKEINTPEKEMFPFVSDDNILFFSSNGHRGLGLLDIFQTKIYDNGSYSKVVNLNYPFNSNKDDFSFYLAKDSRKGFFSSNRAKGKGDDDIYSFYITETPEEEKCYQLITGGVTNKVTKEPILNAIVKLIDDNGTLVEEVVTNSRGIYTFSKLGCKKEKYTVVTQKADYRSANSKSTTTSKSKEFKKIVVNLVLDPLIVGNQIVIKPIYFDYDQAIIRDDAQYELENIVTVMNNHPNMVIKIEAHTDSRGGRAYNRKLSDRRAKATGDFIISRGIEGKRIESAIGFGEDQLLNHCDDIKGKKCTEEEHQLNRRSYFYIVKGKNIKVENTKPVVIDKKGYEDQKLMLERLKKMQKAKKKFKSLRLGRKQDDKCYKGEDHCSKLLK